MKKLITCFLIILISCKDEPKSLTQYINPFIGTGGHGHTYPGASAPFGMMQLSPDSRLEGWDGCSGYHYSDSMIYGFSHTHLSGTGVSDYGDVLLMPTTGKLLLKNGKDGSPGYRSRFSHKNEQAQAGYYQVYLDDHNVNVELTVTRRSGFHKYNFPKNEKAQIILDLEHRDKLLDYSIEMLDSNTIQGIRYSDKWARKQKIHYYIKFSEPLKNINFNDKKSISGIEFGILGRELLVKVGISAVSIESAKTNLMTEIPHWDFKRTKREADKLWEKEINKIVVEGKSEEQKEVFYTALYHSLLNPNLYIDVDGGYNGIDLEKHHTNDKHYTVFSLWDTFRATHPLFTLIQTKRTNEFIRTLLRQYKEGGKLPIWELAANYTGCMIGYHAIPVITDAYVKGIRDYDVDLALEAMLQSAMQDDLGLISYKKNGFIAASDEPESVSKSLEYAYDDWCIALLADSLGKKDIAGAFYERGQNYKNLFDPSTGFFRAKNSHSWFDPFIPEEVNFNYTEANAWQYSLFVPQDIKGHINMMGGNKNYERHLDKMFSSSNKTSGRLQPDITGMIGQYAHGNEPSHHIGYLYNYIGKPYKTQKIIRKIIKEQYTCSPDGLSGNEDCGQMSAWYVLSAMGIYPVTPGLDYYTIGSPIFTRTTLYLENGNKFIIQAKNVSQENIYIQSATLNGNDFNQSFIQHKTITDGGRLIFVMGDTPSNWGSVEIPYSAITKNEIVPVPYFDAHSQTFNKQLNIKLGSFAKGTIYYTTNDGPEQIYKDPIVITDDAKITCYMKIGNKSSKKLSANYYKNDNRKSIRLNSIYANQYAAAGEKTLIDNLRGGENYRTGNWQGYRGDLDVTVDLGKMESIYSIGLGCMQDIKSWIFFPKRVDYFISTDGEKFRKIGEINTKYSDSLEENIIDEHTLKITETKAKYIKIKAQNYGLCPDWHLGAGGKTWIFVDEIIIN